MFGQAFQSMEHGYLNRRNFLKLSGILGLGLATCPIGVPSAEVIKFDKRLYKVSKSRIDMGTIVSMTVLGPSKDHAEEAITIAFQEIERLTKLMSRYDPDTPLAHLNCHQVLEEAPPELLFVIKKSIYYHHISNGFFDITVKPLLDVFAQSRKGPKTILPNEKKISRLLELVDANQILLNEKNITFMRDGMGITLDGIAKGYIVDRASEILIEHDIKNHLINAGGDIRARGVRKDKRPWTVAIQDPQKKSAYPDIIRLTDAAVATSGNYEVYFDREKMFHHIVDPRTGLSPYGSTSVSVVAPTTMEADALSTSVFVMNPSRGTRFINSLPQCESLVITRKNTKVTSSGWKSAAVL